MVEGALRPCTGSVVAPARVLADGATITTTSRTAARVLLLLAALAGRPDAARAASDACLVAWQAPATTVCRDGDAACDADATVDGTCTLRASLCLNRPGCDGVASLRVRGADGVARAAAALAWPVTAADTCTPAADVRVRLEGRARRTATLRATARGGDGARQRARLRVACEGTGGAPRAVVVTTDFETCLLASVTTAPPRRVRRLDARIHSDAVVRASGGMLFVLNRFLGDSVQRLDVDAGLRSRWQCSTGPGSNPHDILVLRDDLAVVSRYDRAQLWLVDPSAARCDGFRTGSVDLGDLADADGLPEIDQLAFAAGRVFVSVQRLDRARGFAPTGPSRLAVLDPSTWERVAVIALPGANAFGDASGIVREPDTGRLLLSTPGDIYDVGDGGIVAVDPVTLAAAPGFLVSEDALGGNVLDFVVASATQGYAIVQDARLGNHLVAFDPTGATPPRDLFARDAFLPDLALAPDGSLWLADMTFTQPGIRIFDAATGRQRGRTPLDVGLPPFSMGFVP